MTARSTHTENLEKLLQSKNIMNSKAPKIENEMNIFDQTDLTEDEAHQLLRELKKEEIALKQLIYEFTAELKHTKYEEQLLRDMITGYKSGQTIINTNNQQTSKSNGHFNYNANHNYNNNNNNTNANHGTNNDNSNTDNTNNTDNADNKEQEELLDMDGDVVLADLFRSILKEDQ